MQIFWSSLAMLVGGVMLAGAILNSERFLQTGRVYLLVQAFGRRFTRGLYVFSGIGCLVFGLYLYSLT